MKRVVLSLGALLASLASCSSDKDGSTPPPTGGSISAVNTEVAYPDLTFMQPLYFGHSGDNSGRVFVVEQDGIILTFDSALATTEVDTFLDIRDRVNRDGWEEGLLGLAFHPQYESNGRFYVNYTAADPRRTVVSRFMANPPSSNAVDRATEQVILTFEQPYANHNGGCLEFGPDGYLYIATGDGGSGGDPHDNGQNTQTLLGKILRIDVNAPPGGLQYGIPADNPFAVATDGSRKEIYAWGLRNPWRFSFDRQTDRLWAADVGQNALEEIDIIEKGKNYGWSIMEGHNCFKPSTGCDSTGLTMPIFQYGRTLGQSVTGGMVYRGRKVPALQGAYLFGDFMSGRLWALFDTAGQEPRVVELPKTELSISSFGVDAQGEVYFTAFDGKIYRFVAREE